MIRSPRARRWRRLASERGHELIAVRGGEAVFPVPVLPPSVGDRDGGRGVATQMCRPYPQRCLMSRGWAPRSLPRSAFEIVAPERHRLPALPPATALLGFRVALVTSPPHPAAITLTARTIDPLVIDRIGTPSR